MRKIGFRPAKNAKKGSLAILMPPQAPREALEKYKKFLKQPGSLSPDLTETICSIAAWNGNLKTFDELKKLYTNAKTMEQKLRFLGAMCGFQDKKLLLKTT